MRLSEDELRKITLTAINELGDKASPDNVKRVVRDVIGKTSDIREQLPASADSGRVILTAFGLNKPGIVAAITNKISEDGCDIQDMTQKLMDNFFSIIMLMDITNSPKDLKSIQDGMAVVADKLHIKIYIQHEDIFRAMHRL